MIDTLLNILAPHVCVVCGAENDLLCIDCGKKCISYDEQCFVCSVSITNGEMCHDCKESMSIVDFTSVGWYKDDLKNAVYTYKFNGKRGGAAPLSYLLHQVYTRSKDHIVTYIPTTAVHMRQRGFDHAKFLAQSFASRASLPCVAVLARTNNHRQLGGNKKQRQKSVAGTFVAVRKNLVINKHIVLIDDVITTGATLREAAKVLLDAGAKSVELLVVAKAPLNH